MLKKFRSIAVWIVGVIAIVAGLAFALRPKPVLVDIERATVGAMQVTVNEDGLTRIKERYIVSTPLAGRLERVQLEVGDKVVADTTVLAKMQATDPSLLDPRAIAQAEARVRAAERRWEAAKAELAQAETAAQFAKFEFARATELRESKAVAESAYESRELEYRIKTEQTRAAQFRVGIAEYELELERAALLLTTSGERPDAVNPASPGDAGMTLEIKSPINGRVLRVYHESSVVLSAGASVIEIGDPDDLEVVTDVLSIDAVRVESGLPVRFENWGGERPLEGEVRIVEPSGFTKLSALGVEEQRVNVISDFLEPPKEHGNLGDGFRVDTHIVVWQGDAVLKIPSSALFRDGEQWQVFRVSGGVAELTDVEIGQNNGIEAQVLGGLDEGDPVIVHPSDEVSAGTKVAIR